MPFQATSLTSQVSQETPEDRALRVKEIAAALDKDSSVIYREIQSGRLPAYRVGTGRGTIRVSRRVFHEYLTAQGIPASELAVAL